MKKQPTLATVQRQVLQLQKTLDTFMKMYMDDQRLFDDIPAIGNIAQATKDRVKGLHEEIKTTVEDTVSEAMGPVIDEAQKIQKQLKEVI